MPESMATVDQYRILLLRPRSTQQTEPKSSKSHANVQSGCKHSVLSGPGLKSETARKFDRPAVDLAHTAMDG